MGGSFTAKENGILTALVADCINYNFSEKEALLYIKDTRGREISSDEYYRRKKMVDSGDYAKEWLNYFSKIEQSKPFEIRNKNEISKLRYEVRESAKLLQELYLGTPIIAQIKAKLENVEMLNSGKL